MSASDVPAVPQLTPEQWQTLRVLTLTPHQRLMVDQMPRMTTEDFEELLRHRLTDSFMGEPAITSAGRLALALYEELHAMARTLEQDRPRYYRAYNARLTPGQYVVQPYDGAHKAHHRLWRWDGTAWFDDRGDAVKEPHSVYGGVLPKEGAPW